MFQWFCLWVIRLHIFTVLLVHPGWAEGHSPARRAGMGRRAWLVLVLPARGKGSGMARILRRSIVEQARLSVVGWRCRAVGGIRELNATRTGHASSHRTQGRSGGTTSAGREASCSKWVAGRLRDCSLGGWLRALCLGAPAAGTGPGSLAAARPVAVGRRRCCGFRADRFRNRRVPGRPIQPVARDLAIRPTDIAPCGSPCRA